MATIRNIATNKFVFLHAMHVFGRNIHCANTYISEKDVSKSHATIFWEGTKWYLQDTSRNGTLVNNEYVRKSAILLQEKSKIQFGNSDLTKWEIVDLNPPTSYLKSLNKNDEVLQLTSCHVFPSEDKPEASFYLSQDQKWVGEIKEEMIILETGKIVRFNNDEWVFVENEVVEDTIDFGHVVRNSYFEFQLSADEENISISILSDGMELNLGNRSHNYLLLSLARKKMLDSQNDFIPENQGWLSIEELIDDISKELRKEIDEYYINLQIYRLRKQLIGLKPYGYLYSNIIERRKGEIRFVHPSFKIQKEKTPNQKNVGIC